MSSPILTYCKKRKTIVKTGKYDKSAKTFVMLVRNLGETFSIKEDIIKQLDKLKCYKVVLIPLLGKEIRRHESMFSEWLKISPINTGGEVERTMKVSDMKIPDYKETIKSDPSDP